MRAALGAFVDDIGARTLPDPLRPGFADMDQKWLFSRESLAAGARQIGFSCVDFVSHHDHASLYRDFAQLVLGQQAGGEAVELPDWGWRILDDFDRALPPAIKRLVMLEGTMVLTK